MTQIFIAIAFFYAAFFLSFLTAKSTLPPDILKNYAATYAYESSNWITNVSTDPFYQTPLDMSAFSPGDYIRFEKTIPPLASPFVGPVGLSLYRLLYVSQDINNISVPASAFVLVPYTSSYMPLRVIAWAHGTSGIQRHCAPSNQRDLYYAFEAPFAMALRGYLVVAPDYAGQGTDTPFNYQATSSHAADVSYAVDALRRVVPRGFMTHDWVAVGHSEGGSTVWGVNEREVDMPIGGFLGAVAIAPALQPLKLERARSNGSLLAYSSFKLSAMAQLYPFINDSIFYTELGLMLRDLAKTACLLTAFAIFENLSFTDVFRDDSWLDADWAMEWKDLTSISGDHGLAQPMLLIQGLNDTATIFHFLKDVFTNHCNSHPTSSVHLSLYPEMEHSEAAFVSQQEIFDWISGRFENVSIPQMCSQRTVKMTPSPIQVCLSRVQ